MASEIKVDTISEKTSANGVTIDSVSLKDGKVATANSIDSDAYVDGSIDNAHIADDAIDSEHYAAGSIDTAHIADDQITLAKMAGGTDGNIISYDASGDPVAISTGSDGQLLTSTGAGSPPAFEAAAGGAWNFLAAQDASDTALIEFDTDDGITASYDQYKVIISNMVPATDDAELYMQMKTGGSYSTGGTDYGYINFNVYMGSSTTHISEHEDQAQIKITRAGTGNASSDSSNWEVTITDPLDTANTKTVFWDGQTMGKSPRRVRREMGSALLNDTVTALQAFKFYMSSGNITKGKFCLYGLSIA